jgi:hypothetical protein
MAKYDSAKKENFGQDSTRFIILRKLVALNAQYDHRFEKRYGY